MIGPYIVGSTIRDDYVSLQHATITDGTPVLLKSGEDLTNEAMTLATLLADPDPQMVPYLPERLGFFTEGLTQCEVFGNLDGFYSLAEVRNAYPDGVDPRDMAWMYRRLLTVLGHVHRAEYMHGGILPTAVWIHPEKHGLILADWDFAAPSPTEVEEDEYEDDDGVVTVETRSLHSTPIVGQHPDYEGAWYPPEVKVGGYMNPASDIYQAAVLMMWLCGRPVDNVTINEPALPREYHTFFAGSLHPRADQRLQDAWRVKEYFDALLEKLYGPKKFRPFSMPVKV